MKISVIYEWEIIGTILAKPMGGTLGQIKKLKIRQIRTFKMDPQVTFITLNAFMIFIDRKVTMTATKRFGRDI